MGGCEGGPRPSGTRVRTPHLRPLRDVPTLTWLWVGLHHTAGLWSSLHQERGLFSRPSSGGWGAFSQPRSVPPHPHPTHGPSSGFCSKLHPASGIGRSVFGMWQCSRQERPMPVPEATPGQRDMGPGHSAQVADSPHTHTHTGRPPWN